MSRWTVPICELCWREEVGPIDPVRLTEPNREDETCYRCKQVTRSGIYVRRQPKESDNV
jgi:hypothetical protein